LSHQLWNLQR